MFPDFLTEPIEIVAKKLLGCHLERMIDGQKVVVRIVETEAYDQEDEASHAFRGQTPRNEIMFGKSGYLYVYFTYGMHYCCNIVTGKESYGAGVLIRAVEPIAGLELLEKRRGVNGIQATNGPAKLCVALGIDKNLYGHDLHNQPLRLLQVNLNPKEEVVTTKRIGIAKAKDRLRRFYIADNLFISKK